MASRKEARELAGTSRVDFQKLFETMNSPLLVLDTDLRIVAANAARVNATGITLEQSLGRYIFDVFPKNPDDREDDGAEKLRISLDRVLKHEVADQMPIQKYDIPVPGSAAGEFEERYWSPINLPILDGRGNLTHILHRVEDVTELMRAQDRTSDMELSQKELVVLKAAQAALRASQMELQTIVDLTPVNMCVFKGPDHRYVITNPAHDRTVGKPVRGLTLHEALSEEERKGVEVILDRIYETGQPFRGQEYPYTSPDEHGILRDKWLNLSFDPIPAPDGSIAGILGVAQDVSEQVIARKKIEQSEKQVRAYAESLPLMTFITDATGSVIYCNQRLYDYVGRPQTDVDGWSWQLGNLIHPDDLERTTNRWLEAVRAGTECDQEYRLRRADGEYRWFLSRAIPRRDESGAITGWYGTNIDIHDQRRQAEALEVARAQADRANEAKSAFLANMSHEIRTPLAAILGFSSLLKERNLDPNERDQYVDTIVRNGASLTRIIDDILDLAKVEAGKLDVEELPFSLYEVATDVVELFRDKAKAKGIHLLLNIDEAVPSQICSDPTRLRQILVNLIGNAIKFTEQGGVRVIVRSSPLEDGRLRIAIDVKDTGIGLTAEQAERLFTPFMQADNSMTRKFGGTGLGLALSQRLSQALRGDISISDCRAGEGCTFTLTFVANYPKRKAATERPAMGARGRENRSLDEMRILVVDDSPDNQFLVARLLTKNGAAVETAKDGDEGFNKALNGSYDVVLMDIQMPGMDGYQAKQALDDCGYEKPVVALTAHAMSEERVKTEAAGFAAHLTKPLVASQLLETVAHLGRAL